MLFTADSFAAFIQALGLSQGVFKPSPTLANTSVAVGAPLPSASGLPLSFQTKGNHGKNGGTKAYDTAGAMDLDSPACQVEPYSTIVDDIVTAPFDPARANIYRYRQQQSVNLGSWFVHEDWMTPSLFTCAAGKRISELDIAHGYGSIENARYALERHWDTFITRSDLEYLASIGINTVRLPIGYWSLGPVFCQGTDFEPVADVYRNSWPRILRVINWAAELGIGVLVDLHGAPGSQNGQSHSGISDGRANLFDDPYNIQKTMDVLAFLAQQFATVTNVVGIQILNEPKNVKQLTSFYDQAIATMRSVSYEAQALPLYVHDGFDLDRFSAYVAGRTDFIVQDHHSYFVFTPEDNAKAAHVHVAEVATKTSGSLSEASSEGRRNLIIGEWSCALTPDSLRNEDSPEDSRRRFCTGQMEVYTNQTAGWSFWAYALESADPGWSFKAAVGRSLPSTFFSYNQNGMRADAPKLFALATVVTNMDTRAKAPTGKALQEQPIKRDRARRRHRFASIHDRRQLLAAPAPALSAVDDGMQPEYTKGYTDGLVTAKLFAAHDLSKLGFIDQYIGDSVTALGQGVVRQGMEGMYKSAFIDGLREGEKIVQRSLDAGTAPSTSLV